MAKFRLKKVAFCAVLGSMSVVAFQKMYRKSKQQIVENHETMRFSHQFPEDARNQTSQGLHIVSDDHFEGLELPKKRELKF